MLLSLQVAGSESTASWSAVVEDLAGRGLPAPALVIVDGNPGLSRAIRETWSQGRVQRCTRHKLENLLAKAPKHAQPEVARDYRGIVDAENLSKAREARERFMRKWERLCPEVARSLAEAGDELLTFFDFPKSQWKVLRTTNQIERLNGEFRRRTKTQGAFANETSALVLLWGLVALGHVRLRRIDGWQDLVQVVRPAAARAA